MASIIPSSLSTSFKENTTYLITSCSLSILCVKVWKVFIAALSYFYSKEFVFASAFCASLGVPLSLYLTQLTYEMFCYTLQRFCIWNASSKHHLLCPLNRFTFLPPTEENDNLALFLAWRYSLFQDSSIILQCHPIDDFLRPE